MNQNENVGAEITLTEENESSTAMYDLSPEDFAALTENATELELELDETFEADTCVCCPERAEHWFKFVEPPEGSYSFSADVCVGARLYDEYGNLLTADNDDGEKDSFLINYTLTQGQVYYLRVMPKLNYFMRFNTAINGTYHSPYEESMAKAQEIYLEVKANGYFSESQREQWYKFTVPENRQYTINATGDLNTIGALYDSSGYLIKEVQGYQPSASSNFRIRRYLTANTTYYVQVREANEESGPFKLLVTEKQLIDSISITPSKLVLGKVGTVYELPTRSNTFLNIEGTKALNDISLTVTPGTAENKHVLWSSLTGNVISIECGWFNGERYYTMTVVGEGTAKLIATDPDGNGKRGECTVYVGGSPVTGIDLECTKKAISVGDSEYILSTVYPPSALNKNVIWKSNNPAIAEVDDEGCVTVHNVGTAIITATTIDGGYTATCTVTGDPRPHVVVEKEVEGGYDFFKVTFPESEGGLIWKSVGMDLDEAPASIYPYHWDRYIFNRTQEFNEKQLAFLYLLDPHGVTRYMNSVSNRFENEDSEEKTYQACMFKDRVYKRIFGINPRLFRILPDDSISYGPDWTLQIDKETRNDYYSDAEVLFGTHIIDDSLTWAVFIVKCGVSIITSLFRTIRYSEFKAALSTAQLCKTVFFAGAINDALSSDTEPDLGQYLKSFMNTASSVTAFIPFWKWVVFILNTAITIVDGLSLFYPSVEQVVIYNKVNSSVDYRVTLKNGATDLTMQELVEYCGE